jgi:hypothetical protein
MGNNGGLALCQVIYPLQGHKPDLCFRGREPGISGTPLLPYDNLLNVFQVRWHGLEFLGRS